MKVDMAESVLGELLGMVKGALAEAGQDVAIDASGVASYAATRAAHLATLVNEPGYAQAVIAERDNVAMAAGMASMRASEELQARVNGLIEGGLVVVARLLAGLAGGVA